MLAYLGRSAPLPEGKVLSEMGPMVGGVEARDLNETLVVRRATATGSQILKLPAGWTLESFAATGGDERVWPERGV